MGSFYGNYSIGGGGSGGTFNYDELLNKPIVNLTGLPDNPIDLSNLQPGEYLLRGYYKYNSSGGEEIEYTDFLKLTVVQDSITQQKNIFYVTTENNKYIIYLITYDENNIDYLITNPSMGNEGTKIVFVDSLEEMGDPEVLYVYDNNIYQWKDDQYVGMTNKSDVGLWGTI